MFSFVPTSVWGLYENTVLYCHRRRMITGLVLLYEHSSVIANSAKCFSTEIIFI